MHMHMRPERSANCSNIATHTRVATLIDIYTTLTQLYKEASAVAAYSAHGSLKMQDLNMHIRKY